MCPKAHLTLYSKMSGSRWVITPSWLSELWGSFLNSSSVYSCHLFLISPTSVRSISFLSFIGPIFARNVPLVPLIFLKRSLVSPILLYSSISFTDHWGRFSYLSLLFFDSLHSRVYLSFLSFAFRFSSFHSFVRPLRQPFCFYALLFLGAGLAPYLLYNVMNPHP